jgi:hypothetical protein
MYQSGHAIVQWTRHYAASQKVAVARPNEGTIFFDVPDPPNRNRPCSLLSL